MLIELTPNEHQAIIEEIRCSSKLTTSEKEKMVETYVLFSQQLSRDTCRLITQGEDPDFQRTVKKVVNYREFIKFIQELQERDALIAKLLYYCLHFIWANSLKYSFKSPYARYTLR
ncbi:MAG TPA: hypothetical protein VIH61_05380 [Waddliaceae bacterium]